MFRKATQLWQWVFFLLDWHGRYVWDVVGKCHANIGVRYLSATHTGLFFLWFYFLDWIFILDSSPDALHFYLNFSRTMFAIGLLCRGFNCSSQRISFFLCSLVFRGEIVYKNNKSWKCYLLAFWSFDGVCAYAAYNCCFWLCFNKHYSEC